MSLVEPTLSIGQVSKTVYVPAWYVYRTGWDWTWYGKRQLGAVESFCFGDSKYEREEDVYDGTPEHLWFDCVLTEVWALVIQVTNLWRPMVVPKKNVRWLERYLFTPSPRGACTGQHVICVLVFQGISPRHV